MTMSDESQQTDLFQTELELMSSREDSPVRTSPLQEIKKELMQNAVDCGQSAPVCLGTFDPDMPSLKTSQTCLLETGEIGLSEFYGTFPRSGTMRNGTVYQLPQLAPTITEIGSGLWPTPTGMTGGEGIAPSHKDGTHGWSLGAAAKDSLTQKPIRIWPTPNASDNRDRGCMEDEAIKRRIRIGKQVGLSTAVKETRQSGTLNPTWVEWLMGFPLGHTDLDA